MLHGAAIDVPFPVATGFRLVASTLADFNEFTLGGAGLGSVQIDTRVAPQLLTGGTSVRYMITGTFAAAGAVTVTFTRGRWSVVPATGGSQVVDSGAAVTTTIGEIGGNQAFLTTGSYFTIASKQYYFGGEPVLDPFTGVALEYAGGEAVRDLFTGAVLRDPFGNVIRHVAGDPMLHIAGEPVYRIRGQVVEYLGGEATFDEKGNQVFTGSTPFLHEPGQAQIFDRGERAYDFLATVSSPFSALSQVGGSDTRRFVDVSWLARGLVLTGATPDRVTVTLYERTKIINLVEGVDYTIVAASGADDDRIVLSAALSLRLQQLVALPASDPDTLDAKLAFVIAVPAVHTATDPWLYLGNEALEANQPVVDAQGNLVLDPDGQIALHGTADHPITQLKKEVFFYQQSIRGGVITLTYGVLGNPREITVLLGARTLTTAEYTLTATAARPAVFDQLTLAAAPAFGERIQVTYTAPRFHRRGEIQYHSVTVTDEEGVEHEEWQPLLHAAGDPRYTLGNEARRWTGGEHADFDAADPVQMADPRSRLVVDPAQPQVPIADSGPPLTQPLPITLPVTGTLTSVDIVFPVLAGYVLNAASIADLPAEFVLGGTGLGSVSINTAVPAKIQADGRTVRYALTGTFAAAGTVDVTFTRGSWLIERPVFWMPGEIQYFGIEHVTLGLGSGDDLVTVVTTHTALTEVETAPAPTASPSRRSPARRSSAPAAATTRSTSAPAPGSGRPTGTLLPTSGRRQLDRRAAHDRRRRRMSTSSTSTTRPTAQQRRHADSSTLLDRHLRRRPARSLRAARAARHPPRRRARLGNTLHDREHALDAYTGGASSYIAGDERRLRRRRRLVNVETIAGPTTIADRRRQRPRPRRQHGRPPARRPARRQPARRDRQRLPACSTAGWLHGRRTASTRSAPTTAATRRSDDGARPPRRDGR